MIDLSVAVSYGVKFRPPRVLVYGCEGIGKSTFASRFPEPIFLPTEDGIDQIDCAKMPLSKTLAAFEEQLDALIAQDHRFQTVVIDSIDWLERLIWDDICLKNGKAKSIETVLGGYGRGYVAAFYVWREICGKLETLRDRKNTAVVLIAHAKTETLEDPESSKRQQFSPRLHKLAQAYVNEWVDAILFATRERAAALGDVAANDRVLRTTPSGSRTAKNHYDLPETIPMDAAAFLNLVRRFYQSKKEPAETGSKEG